MKKIIRIASSLLLAMVMMITSILNVNAASETISIGQAQKIGTGYIAGVTFSYKVTSDGRYLFCLDKHKNTASNVQAKLVSNSGYIDGGLIYILKNGYPEKSITGDKEKDYYITQTAVWWYLDSVKGKNNLGSSFKETGSDSYNLRQHVKNLVNAGINHKNDPVEPTEPKLSLGVANSSFYLQNGYYYSNAIKANAQNISSYTVTLGKVLPDTTIILDGKEFKYTGAFNVGVNSSFQIRVPAAALLDTSYTVPVTATATGNTEYRAYEYQPVNTKMQNVVLVEKSNRKASTSLNLTVTSSRVAITKVDAETKKPVAGATLVLKDASGKVLDTWVTTTTTHYIRNLADGVYTVEETKTPNGYVLSKQTVSVTINANNRDVKVSFENSKSGKLVINKIDADTKQAIAGATLVLKNSAGKVVDTWTTTTSGHAISNLTPGTYTVEETKAPDGYALSKEVVKVNVTSTTKDIKVSFENTKLAKLSITKIDADTKKPIAGATLVLKDSTGKQIAKWTTTVNAHVIKNLEPGTYTVKEVAAPKGYLLSNKEVTVKITKDVKEYKVTFENAPKNVVININKLDQETNKPLAGAVLVVKDNNGKVIDRFTTTEEAHVLTDIANGTYTVEEEAAPAGYIKSNEVVTFTVDDNHLSHQITIVNAREIYVPDTGSESIIMFLVGAIIIGIGLEYVLKNVKA